MAVANACASQHNNQEVCWRQSLLQMPPSSRNPLDSSPGNICILEEIVRELKWKQRYYNRKSDIPISFDLTQFRGCHIRGFKDWPSKKEEGVFQNGRTMSLAWLSARCARQTRREIVLLADLGRFWFHSVLFQTWPGPLEHGCATSCMAAKVTMCARDSRWLEDFR